MSEEKTIISEAELEAVAGGVTRDLIAAYACIRGEYGNGNDRIVNLRRAGYDPNVVQGLVNGVMAGHDRVARDVINGVYGNGTDRVINLRRAGYSDADINSIQNLVNHTLWK